MNRSILIVICDFLLVSLLAFSTVDINKATNTTGERRVSTTLATNQNMPPDPSEQTKSSPRRTHQMRPGDTLTVVSIMYNVPIEAIRDANPNVNVNVLKPGDVLIIPPWPQPSNR